MNKNFEELLLRFNEIKNKGYIKANSKNKTFSGITFEQLIKSSGGNFCIPDFKDIELKVISDRDKSMVNLFNSGPDGKYICPTQWLTTNFGYPDKQYREFKVLKGDIYADKYQKIGLKNYFKLKVDKKNKKIILLIYDLKYNLINDEIYWDFDSLETRIIHKLKNLAIVKVEYHYSNNSYYYYFKKIELYQFKSFDNFIDAINDGFIAIKLNTGIHKSGYKKGQFHDHGTTFKILSTHIEKIFSRIH